MGISKEETDELQTINGQVLGHTGLNSLHGDGLSTNTRPRLQYLGVQRHYVIMSAVNAQAVTPKICICVCAYAYKHTTYTHIYTKR